MKYLWAAIFLCPIFGLTINAADLPAPDLVSGAMSVLPAEWQKYLGTLLMLIGALRLCVKPVVSAIHAYAASTGTKADDDFLASIENSKALRGFFFFIDLLLSVKPYRGAPGASASANQTTPPDATAMTAPAALAGTATASAAGFATLKAMLAMSAILASCALVGFLSGCASRLETGGAYAPGVITVANGQTNVVATSAPDMGLFLVDQTFNLMHSTADAVFETERQNRAFLWSVSHDIKHTLDRYRPQAKAAVIEYATARKAYLSNPTPAGLSTLQTISGRLQQVADAVSAAMPKGAK